MDKHEQGRALRRLRERHGGWYSQSELARRANVSASHIARVERGERGMTVEMAVKIAPKLLYQGERLEDVLRSLGFEHVPQTAVAGIERGQDPIAPLWAALEPLPLSSRVRERLVALVDSLCRECWCGGTRQPPATIVGELRTRATAAASQVELPAEATLLDEWKASWVGEFLEHFLDDPPAPAAGQRHTA